MIDADAFNASEAAGWEARAAEYDTYWPALTSRLSDALLDSVDAGPDTRVLDIACGPVISRHAGRSVVQRPSESTSQSHGQDRPATLSAGRLPGG